SFLYSLISLKYVYSWLIACLLYLLLNKGEDIMTRTSISTRIYTRWSGSESALDHAPLIN
uniref:Uncharacterized protein n=1 Tax=Oryza brachyantha TaxID=4533 RepID=J3MZC8_ORYBR